MNRYSLAQVAELAGGIDGTGGGTGGRYGTCDTACVDFVTRLPLPGDNVVTFIFVLLVINYIFVKVLGFLDLLYLLTILVISVILTK